MQKNINKFLDFARDILSGEPARAIGYGGAIIFYLAGRFTGVIDPVDFGEAVVQVTAGVTMVAAVIETIRKYVYSPNTVELIIDTLDPNGVQARG